MPMVFIRGHNLRVSYAFMAWEPVWSTSIPTTIYQQSTMAREIQEYFLQRLIYCSFNQPQGAFLQSFSHASPKALLCKGREAWQFDNYSEVQTSAKSSIGPPPMSFKNHNERGRSKLQMLVYNLIEVYKNSVKGHYRVLQVVVLLRNTLWWLSPSPTFYKYIKTDKLQYVPPELQPYNTSINERKGVISQTCNQWDGKWGHRSAYQDSSPWVPSHLPFKEMQCALKIFCNLEKRSFPKFSYKLPLYHT